MAISSLMKMAESSSKWVENNVGKGEKEKPGFVWERVNINVLDSNKWKAFS